MQNRDGEYIQLSMYNCQWCGKPLPKGRADMKCHKDCRQRMYRAKKRNEREVKKALDVIQRVARDTRYEFYREDGIELLKMLSREVNNAYAYNNIRRVQ